MSIFDGNMPYTNLHELNNDWIIKTVKEVYDKAENIEENVERAEQSAENAHQSELNAKESEDSVREIADDITEYTTSLQNQVDTNTANIAVESARIDEIIIGSTTDPDAELIDIRVGADGVTYATAGDSVRNQINSINNSIPLITVVSSNLFDYDSAEIGYYRNASDTPVANQHFICTNLIDVRNINTLYCKHFDGQSTVGLNQVLRYNSEGNFIDRLTIGSGSVGVPSWTVTGASFIRFNIEYNASADVSERATSLMISTYDPGVFEPYGSYKRTATCKVLKNSDTQYNIIFGDCSMLLFKTVDASTNSDNWNIGTVRIKNNIVIPENTDILGPILCNNNTDYIGGVHGDETTDFLYISVDGKTFEIQQLEHDLYGEEIIITMNSRVFDEVNGNHLFNRIIQLKITPNHIKVSNCYKAVQNCTLRRATNGGLLASYSDLIKSIAFNTVFYPNPPTSPVDIANRNNVTATINTIYGAMTVTNLIGNQNDNYSGWLQVFHTEARPRCKIYFDTYKSGHYNLSSGDVINGEFEYSFS